MNSIEPKRRSWFWWFQNVPEPRSVTVGYAIIYAVLVVVGVSVMIDAPLTIQGEIGSGLTNLWGGFLIVGGLSGSALVWTRYWWLERIAVLIAGAGAAVYLGVVGLLIFTAGGNRIVQGGFIVIAVVTLIMRYFRIRGFNIEPGK